MAAQLAERTEVSTRDLVDALLGASQVLVAVAARSLAAYEGEVTLAQYRVLVILCSRGPQRVVDLAEEMAVAQPNATRICDRLCDKRMVQRARSSHDRRSVRISITAEGREVIAQVSAARRAELSCIVEQMAPDGREQAIDSLRRFTAAGGEGSQHGWALGWGQ